MRLGVHAESPKVPGPQEVRTPHGGGVGRAQQDVATAESTGEGEKLLGGLGSLEGRQHDDEIEIRAVLVVAGLELLGVGEADRGEVAEALAGSGHREARWIAPVNLGAEPRAGQEIQDRAVATVGHQDPLRSGASRERHHLGFVAMTEGRDEGRGEIGHGRAGSGWRETR